MLLLSVVLLNALVTLYAKPGQEGGKADELSSRVWSGQRANIKDYPYFALLPILCGAGIISESWLVTAAHCVEAMTGNLVWVGGDSIQTSKMYTIDEAVIHPEYSYLEVGVVNDIALLHLSAPLTFSDSVRPLELPEKEYELNAVHKFAGHGQDQTPKMTKHLMSMNARTLEPEECLTNLQSTKYYDFFESHFDQIKNVTICIKRIEDLPGVCFGDSGSPLVRNNTFVGIASYIPNTCESSTVSMFTNVAPFVGWIKEVTGIEEEYEDYQEETGIEEEYEDYQEETGIEEEYEDYQEESEDYYPDEE